MTILLLGATSKIAEDLARQYCLQLKNISFILVGRNSDKLRVIQQDLETRGAQAKTIVSDLNDFNLHSELVEKIYTFSSNLDRVVSCHGYLGSQDLAEKNQQEALTILNSNFVSHASIITLIAEKMKSTKAGSIAIITSVAAARGKQSNLLYCAAKAGLSVFAAGLRNRLFPYQIQVTELRLGFTDTPMTKDFKKGLLWSSSNTMAKLIYSAIERKKSCVYLPSYWAIVMLIIQSVPEFLFKRMKM